MPRRRQQRLVFANDRLHHCSSFSGLVDRTHSITPGILALVLDHGVSCRLWEDITLDLFILVHAIDFFLHLGDVFSDSLILKKVLQYLRPIRLLSHFQIFSSRLSSFAYFRLFSLIRL